MSAKNHDERIAGMTFASVYPHYLAKVEKKGRTKAELHRVILWLTGIDEAALQKQIKGNTTFEQFFQRARINANAHLITGVICGYRVEDIENPLTRKVRYLDKLVDELANGREMRKILRGSESLQPATSGAVKVEDPGGTQSPAARRAAEAEVRTLIDTYAPAHLRLIGALRKGLLKRLPAAHEVVYEYQNQGAVVISYSPNEHGYEGVLALRASADGVKLYFNQGKDLPDPAKLLQGSSQTRWIPIEGASTLTRPEVARLIEEAIARTPVPFARAGRGSVVIRPTSAKKRRPA